MTFPSSFCAGPNPSDGGGGVVCNSSELLYLLRSAARIHYGLTELMFGVLCVLAFAQSAAAELQAPAIIQLTGGMYIIVRGLDNVKNGLDENKSSRVWKAWNLLFSEARIDRLRRAFGTPIKAAMLNYGDSLPRAELNALSPTSSPPLIVSPLDRKLRYSLKTTI